jgi:MoaA/NifB/PqqE/SkfB family radical SAM enzyme
MISKNLKRGLYSLTHDGIGYTYNMAYYYMRWFWIPKHPLLIDIVNRLAPYPSYLEIEVSTVCGLRCIMCEHTYWKEPSINMTFEQFKGIVDQFPSLKWIGLTGIGESFVNPDFMKMLEYVKKRKTYVELYDNFFFVDKAKIERLVDLKIEKIFFSFDAATKETYEKIRVNSNFDIVVNNIKYIYEVKKKKNAHYPELSFHYIINKSNVHELVKYVEFVHSIAGEGATIQFSKMLHSFKETAGLFAEVPKETMELVEKRAKELGVYVYMGGDAPKSLLPIQRCMAWTMPFIFVTGEVIPCCEGNEAGHRDFQKATSLGNVFQQSFKDIWYGEKYKTLREQIRAGGCPAPCRNCVMYYGGKNDSNGACAKSN